MIVWGSDDSDEDNESVREDEVVGERVLDKSGCHDKRNHSVNVCSVISTGWSCITVNVITEFSSSIQSVLLSLCTE